ncbi:MAG: hypothetical protein AB1627_16230 [Chloroflexota bacterium]
MDIVTAARLYPDWPRHAARLTDAVRDLTVDQLALRASPAHLPIWGLAAHVAGERWTIPMLEAAFERRYGDIVQVHTRASVLNRLVAHDAYHAGEMSQVLGVHALPVADPWRRA